MSVHLEKANLIKKPTEKSIKGSIKKSTKESTNKYPATIVKKAKQNLIKFIKSTNTNVDIKKISKAIDFATKAHELQKRASGEPYILHPIEVAKLIAELKLDTTSIIVALLHDTIEDTQCTLEDIKKIFGKKEAELVNGVTKLNKLEAQAENVKQAENLRKLLLAVSKDIRVLLIKLADRVHNMRTLHFFKQYDKRIRIAKETFEIYAPLAERIGLHKFKNELHDLAFAEIYPEMYISIKNRLKYLKNKGLLVIDKNVKEIKELLHSKKINAEVTGREKTPHSIWRKMENKKIAFEELSDIIAFRVLVNNIQDCYRVLGIMHQYYHAIPSGFQDYISNPKINGYKSLHTLIIGPQKRCIELQIRTYEMHEIAELGIAAHWTYKQAEESDKINKKQYKWIKQLYDILENTSNPDEILENARLEMNYNQVFCFTPKGDLIALPKFSTPIDFAFALNSKIGLSCLGAKINGKLAPLKIHLENGDQVEILKANEFTVNPSWENIVVTGKAKAEISKFLKSKKHNEFINLGRVILAKAIKKTKYKYNELDFVKILSQLEKDNIEDMLSDIGKGLISSNTIIKFMHSSDLKNTKNNTCAKDTHSSNGFMRIGRIKGIKNINNKIKILKNKFNPLNTFNILKFKNIKNKSLKNDIVGLNLEKFSNNITTHLANCCCPLPGDKIIGLLISEEGIVIHTTDCNTMKNFKKDDNNSDHHKIFNNDKNNNKIINLSWSSDSKKFYLTRLKIIIINESGSFASVANTLTKLNINISNIVIVEKSIDFFEVLLDIELYSLEQMRYVINELKKLNILYSVTRYKGM